MAFWTIALILAAAIAAALFRAARRAGAAAGRAAAEADLAVYRDQLAEVERDAARGVIDAEEAARARVEISRRILEADRAAGGAAAAAGGAGPRAALLVALALALGGAVPLYLWLGAPGYPDLPIAARLERAAALKAGRPGQQAAEAEAAARGLLPARPEPDPAYAALIDKLRAKVAQSPDDLTGQRLLARHEAALGNFAAAARAQERVIALLGEAAGAEDYATLADDLVLAAGGYVSPEAERALDAALKRDPGNPTARFYAGLMWAQTGRPDIAFGLWRRLLEEGPEDAPWIPPIRARIGLLAQAAGVDYTPPAPPGARGPGAADIAAAAGMSAEDRQAMIRTMVEGLAERLASEGGPAADWARLITSLGVLGETERARAIWRDAQSTFAGHPADLDTIRAAAVQAGVAE
ncbi:c-type cytochrome biogenesis protein CcmI [Albidovulum sp.]